MMENVMTAIRLVPLDHYLILSFLLFSIGMVRAWAAASARMIVSAEE